MKKKNYIVKPPPSESGDQPLFRVVYEIDVNASDEQNAAQTAWQLMRVKNAFGPFLTVLDSQGKQTQLDLLDFIEFNKITAGFVSQKFQRQDDGKFICTWQEFIASDDVQYENVNGEAIEAPEHEYQPFEMSLIRTRLIIDRITEVLLSLDVGSEQSKVFQKEIRVLKEIVGQLSHDDHQYDQSKPEKAGKLTSPSDDQERHEGKCMTKAGKTNMARLLYDSYPGSDLLPIDPEQDCVNLETLQRKVTSEHIGDTLFKFIVIETVEGGQGTVAGAIKVLERAGMDIASVLQALYDVQNNP